VRENPNAVLQLHLEPASPIEVSSLNGALFALVHQYQKFVSETGVFSRPADTRLLIASVKPGSIDINFIPDLSSIAALLVPIIDQAQFMVQFGERIKSLLDYFSPKKEKEASQTISVRDCDDAINLVNPSASTGGTQNIIIINEDVTIPVLSVDAAYARQVTEGATYQKVLMQNPEADTRQRVPFIWSRLDRDKAKTGAGSPNRGLIEEIDQKPHVVLFTDEMSYLKADMIVDEANPLQMVYFVDVSISRAFGKIVAYRIIGYHGKEPLD
jgi:hypothetical protein